MSCVDQVRGDPSAGARTMDAAAPVCGGQFASAFSDEVVA
jgi:hypothetical protein